MSIAVTELRVGNDILFNAHDTTWTVFHINEVADLLVVEDTPQAFQSIELNEEWLLKFGFEKSAIKYNYILEIPHRKLIIDLNYETASISRQVVSFKFTYVNQLQNLYFALTGEELQLKE